MEMVRYSPVIKLGESETRAIEHLSPLVREAISPVIEITKGRGISKTKPDGTRFTEYPFDNRLSLFAEKFEHSTVFMDVASDEGLTNDQIDMFYSPDNGYNNWRLFLRKQKDSFAEIIPAVLLNFNDPDFESNIKIEVRELIREFKAILYRFSLFDKGAMQDYKTLIGCIGDSTLYILIDCGYVQSSLVRAFLKNIEAYVDFILKESSGKNVKIIVSGTSFPENLSEIGRDGYDVFPDSIVAIHSQLSNEKVSVIYSDFAAMQVKKNAIRVAKGWVPRIDVPLDREFFYYRKRRDSVLGYGQAYIDIAKMACDDPKFPIHLAHNWGVDQIMQTANGNICGASPSFWKSVRMSIHIEQQCLSRGLLKTS